MHQESPPTPTKSIDRSSAQMMSSPRSSDVTARASISTVSLEDDINTRLKRILTNAYDIMKSGKVPDLINGIAHLNLLNEKIKFLSSNGRKFDPKIELLCLYNMGCGYQQLAFDRDNVEALGSCIASIEKAIAINKDILSANKEKNVVLKLTFLQAKMNLQYCALLSQVERHQEAQQFAIESINLLIEIFTLGLTECKFVLREFQTSNQEVICFKKHVLEKAKKCLEQMVQAESYQQIIESNHSDLLKIKQNNYFWKNNFENNEKSLRKELRVGNSQSRGQDRNILGIKVSHNWIKDYSIGKVMHMQLLELHCFQEPDNIAYEFNSRNMLEKIILTSATYFSIATQMRFLESEQAKAKNDKQKHDKVDTSVVKRSEIFHLKAIETVCRYVKESSILVDHLINSYHRHYNSHLGTIDEESSSAEYSLLSASSKEQESIPNKLGCFGEYLAGNATPKLSKEPAMSKSPIFLFKKKKKKTLMESVELDREAIMNRQEKEHEVWFKERTLKKQMRKRMEKSSSLTHLTSLRSDKKSISSRATDSHTIKLIKSPSSTPLVGRKKSPTKLKKLPTRAVFTQRDR